MASNGAADSFTTPNVLQAMLTMRSGDSSGKKAAMDYLQKFQKSVSCALALPTSVYLWYACD